MPDVVPVVAFFAVVGIAMALLLLLVWRMTENNRTVARDKGPSKWSRSVLAVGGVGLGAVAIIVLVRHVVRITLIGG